MRDFIIALIILAAFLLGVVEPIASAMLRSPPAVSEVE
jgi:hypothetical protein